MSSPSSVLTYGLGAWGTPSLLITLGFGSGTAVTYSKNGNLYLEIDKGAGLSIMLGALKLPTWNTGGRPTGNYVVGFNTDTSKLEFYNGSSWVGVVLA